MKTLLVLIGAVCACAVASARPLVLESDAVVPAYSDDFGFAGDDLINNNSHPVANSDPEQFRNTASLYHRGADGNWLFVRDLVTEDGEEWDAPIGMTTSVAAIPMPNGLRVFEHSASGWTEASVDPASRIKAVRVDVVGNDILMTDGLCSSQASVLTRGTTGVWALSAHLDAPAGGCIDKLDLDDGRAIVHVSYGDDVPSNAVVFERSGSSWNAAGTLQPQDTDTTFGPYVALHGTLALVSQRRHATNVYRRTSTGWQPAGVLPNPDSDGSGEDFAVGINGQYVAKVSWILNRRTPVVNIFRPTANQGFEHVAILAAPGSFGFSDARIYGSRVVAGSGPDLHVFDLPANFDVPPLAQDDFESGSAQQWTVMPGGQWNVVSNGQTHFYRQSSVAGDAGAIYPADLTNQHVSADIRPLAYNGNDRWVGLMTRYTDPSNYYYVTLRNTNTLVLKRVVNGVITTLASFQTGATLQWHRIGLESSGTQQAVYLDNNLVMLAYDGALSHGHPGLRTYRASADFDNVVVTPGPLASLAYNDRVATGGDWTVSWSRETATFSQTLTDSGDARALSGLPRSDVSVQADVSVDGVTSTGSPWAGLIARYVDSRNYYYVTVRANEISLRQLTNGAITVLGSHAFTRSRGIPVKLRLEAIGDRLRVYVDDELWIEHAGAEVVAGKVGAVTYRAAATFSNYLAIEP